MLSKDEFKNMSELQKVDYLNSIAGNIVKIKGDKGTYRIIGSNHDADVLLLNVSEDSDLINNRIVVKYNKIKSVHKTH